MKISKKALISFIGNFIFYILICIASVIIPELPHPTRPSLGCALALLLLILIVSILTTVIQLHFIEKKKNEKGCRNH